LQFDPALPIYTRYWGDSSGVKSRRARCLFGLGTAPFLMPGFGRITE